MSANMTTLLLAVLLVALLGFVVDVRSQQISCTIDMDCPVNPGYPAFLRRCCRGYCIYSWYPRCDAEVPARCKRDSDCPDNQCCALDNYARDDGVCSSEAPCRKLCLESSDCARGACCQSRRGHFGLCGTNVTEFCECEHDEDCDLNLRCRMTDWLAQYKTCIKLTIIRGRY